MDTEAVMRGKFSKWCSAGVDIAERASIKEEITSVEAGWMVIRFTDLRRVEEEGNERRCCSLGRRDVRAGIMGEESVILAEGMGPECQGDGAPSGESPTSARAVAPRSAASVGI